MRTSDMPLIEFVSSLCESEAKLKQFQKNPRATMRKAHLALKYQDALEDRDTALINKYMEQEYKKAERRAKKAPPPAKVAPPAGGWPGSGVKRVYITEDWTCVTGAKKTTKRK